MTNSTPRLWVSDSTTLSSKTDPTETFIPTTSDEQTWLFLDHGNRDILLVLGFYYTVNETGSTESEWLRPVQISSNITPSRTWRKPPTSISTSDVLLGPPTKRRILWILDLTIVFLDTESRLFLTVPVLLFGSSIDCVLWDVTDITPITMVLPEVFVGTSLRRKLHSFDLSNFEREPPVHPTKT